MLVRCFLEHFSIQLMLMKWGKNFLKNSGLQDDIIEKKKKGLAGIQPSTAIYVLIFCKPIYILIKEVL